MSSIEEIDRVTSIPDPVVRNLNITQSYYEISAAMAKLTGISPCWCTYAVWASKQAGQSVRKEDLRRTFDYYFSHSPEASFILEELLAALKNVNELKGIREDIIRILGADAVFERSAEAVANGNRKVYEEIGREFARFISFFRSDESFTAEKINEFCSSLKPGDPPDGQQLLRDAFTAYCSAKLLNDQKEKTEMIHYANLLIGFHEQTRLQDDIVAAMDSALNNPDEIKQKILKLLLPGFWLRIRYYIAKLFRRKMPLDEAIDELIGLSRRQVREVITRFLMSLNIPGSPVLRLGNNLQIGFPEVLTQLTNQNLVTLLGKIDPTPDSNEESGAEDWGDLADRIHFIADFFRCYHAHASLCSMPFSAGQVLLIKEGKRPGGTL